ncbi:hypothetical protein BOQ57_17775 [Aeromonas hydrophila]|nr:hypothetical protein BOQ57_17775 [Aeromonas hydrophila]
MLLGLISYYTLILLVRREYKLDNLQERQKDFLLFLLVWIDSPACTFLSHQPVGMRCFLYATPDTKFMPPFYVRKELAPSFILME